MAGISLYLKFYNIYTYIPVTKLVLYSAVQSPNISKENFRVVGFGSH